MLSQETVDGSEKPSKLSFHSHPTAVKFPEEDNITMLLLCVNVFSGSTGM